MTTLAVSLVNLALQIRVEVDAADADWQSALDHAIKAGELLAEAKTCCNHGEWLPWLKANGFAVRNAQNYMKLAANTQEPAYLESGLTIESALKALTKSHEDPHGLIDPFDFARVFTEAGEVAGPDFNLPEGVVFRQTGLELPDDLPREEYDRICVLLGQVARLWPSEVAA